MKESVIVAILRTMIVYAGNVVQVEPIVSMPLLTYTVIVKGNWGFMEQILG